MARRFIYRRIGQFIAILLKDHIIPGNERHRIAGFHSAGSSAGCARPGTAVGNIKMNIVQLVLYCRQLAIIDGIHRICARCQTRNLTATRINAAGGHRGTPGNHKAAVIQFRCARGHAAVAAKVHVFRQLHGQHAVFAALGSHYADVAVCQAACRRPACYLYLVIQRNRSRARIAVKGQPVGRVADCNLQLVIHHFGGNPVGAYHLDCFIHMGGRLIDAILIA